MSTGRVAIAVVSLLVVLSALATAAFAIARPAPTPPAPAQADPALRAFVAAHLAETDGVAGVALPLCSGHAVTASPAVGSAIAAAPETLGVSATCFFELRPHSGSAHGTSFPVWGTVAMPNGSWIAFGASGNEADACHDRVHSCVDYWVSRVDPHLIAINAIRRFPTDDGWVEVTALLRRP